MNLLKIYLNNFVMELKSFYECLLYFSSLKCRFLNLKGILLMSFPVSFYRHRYIFRYNLLLLEKHLRG